MNRIDQIIELVKTNPSPGLVLALLIAVATLSGTLGKVYYEKDDELTSLAKSKDSVRNAEVKELKIENAQLRQDVYNCKDQVIERTDEVVKRALEANDRISAKFEQNRIEREKLFIETKKAVKEGKEKITIGTKLIEQNSNGS